MKPLRLSTCLPRAVGLIRELRRSYDALRPLLEVSMVAVQEAVAAKQILSGADVFAHASKLSSLDQEHVLLLCLDAKSRLTREEVISKGTVDCAIVHPRDVFRVAIASNAVSVILVHNHPSGDPEPSQGDRIRTKQLAKVANLVAIDLRDHVIVGANSFCSLRTTHPELFGEPRTASSEVYLTT
jgi:DNA repair protein RadC